MSTVNVTLDIKPATAAGAPPGYTEAPAYEQGPNQPPKSVYYRFSGGNTDADDGSIDFHVGEGPKKIVVAFSSTTGAYLLTSGFASADNPPTGTHSDLHTNLPDGGARSIIFTDDDTHVEDGYFGVTATEITTINGVVAYYRYRCDPRWKNEP